MQHPGCPRPGPGPISCRQSVPIRPGWERSRVQALLDPLLKPSAPSCATSATSRITSRATPALSRATPLNRFGGSERVGFRICLFTRFLSAATTLNMLGWRHSEVVWIGCEGLGTACVELVKGCFVWSFPPQTDTRRQGGQCACLVFHFASGGLGYIGLNGLLVEVGDHIYLVGVGLNFRKRMSRVDTDSRFGVYSIPGRAAEGILLTHGHEDHIGGVSHLPLHESAMVLLAIALLESDLRNSGSAENPSAGGGKGRPCPGRYLGEFIRMTHSIPDCFSLAIRTPEGIVFHTGDWKWDEEPVDGEHLEWDRLEELGREDWRFCSGIVRTRKLRPNPQ